MEHDRIDNKLATRSACELADVPALPVTFELRPVDLMTLLGVIQLALRYPELPANARNVAQALAKAIEYKLASFGPATAEICARGWSE